MNPEIVAPPAEEMGDPKSPAALEEIHVQERRPIFGLCNIAHLMTPQVGKLRPPFEIELPHKGCACLAFAIYMFIGAVLVLAPGNAKGLLPIISEMCLTYMMTKVEDGQVYDEIPGVRLCILLADYAALSVSALGTLVWDDSDGGGIIFEFWSQRWWFVVAGAAFVAWFGSMAAIQSGDFGNGGTYTVMLVNSLLLFGPAVPIWAITEAPAKSKPLLLQTLLPWIEFLNDIRGGAGVRGRIPEALKLGCAGLVRPTYFCASWVLSRFLFTDDLAKTGIIIGSIVAVDCVLDVLMLDAESRGVRIFDETTRMGFEMKHITVEWSVRTSGVAGQGCRG